LLKTISTEFARLSRKGCLAMQASSQKTDILTGSPYSPFVNWQQEEGGAPPPSGLSQSKHVVTTTTTHATDDVLSQPSPDNLQVEASRVLSLLSGKWTCELLWVLGNRAVRLSELRRRMPRTSKKVLVEELRKLEQVGLLLRTDLSQHHIKHVEYRLAEDVYPEVQHLLETLAFWGLTLKKRHTGMSYAKELVTGKSREN
jgi:DNA-binding HxlR family transcriptional regulator